MASGEKIIIGVDEVGRGALAGPVIACAITGPAKLKIKNEKLKITIKNSKLLKDSKKLSPKKRREIYNFLKNSPNVLWGIGRAGERTIDRINIFEATKLAMIRAVKNLEKIIKTIKHPYNYCYSNNCTDSQMRKLLLIDGNFGIDLNVPQKSVVKGDEKIPIISLASIVAKVERDRIMVNFHKKFPGYGFDRHKGYGTKEHLKNLARYGPRKIHRKTFKPISELLRD